MTTTNTTSKNDARNAARRAKRAAAKLAAQAPKFISTTEKHWNGVSVTNKRPGVLAVMGPDARRLMKRVSNAGFSNAEFPYLSHREIEIGGVVARAALGAQPDAAAVAARPAWTRCAGRRTSSPACLPSRTSTETRRVASRGRSERTHVPLTPCACTAYTQVLATHQAQLLEASRPGGALRWLGYLSSTGASRPIAPGGSS
jgi:hypothetical protein